MELLTNHKLIELSFQHIVLESAVARAVVSCRQSTDFSTGDLQKALDVEVNNAHGAASRLNDAYLVILNTFETELDLLTIQTILSPSMNSRLVKAVRFMERLQREELLSEYYANVVHLLLHDVNTDDFVEGHMEWAEFCKYEIEGDTDEEVECADAVVHHEGINSSLPLQRVCTMLLTVLT